MDHVRNAKTLMNYQKLNEKATPGPVHMDNCFTLCDSNEAYVAQIDATEDPEHRALATGIKLAHCWNHFDELLGALKANEHEIRRLYGKLHERYQGCVGDPDIGVADVAAKLIAKCEEVNFDD